MSETLSLKETAHIDAQYEGDECIGKPSQDLGDCRSAGPNTDNSRPPSPNGSVPLKGEQSHEKIENLVGLFRDFLEAAPNKVAFDSTFPEVTQLDTARRKRLFGLAKRLSPEAGSNNRYDYEQKYPRDEFGKEAAENARVWLTYLDEAESFDRERVEGWKETVDVLLVFAGLFSGVITTFIAQASQSLQKDNTQVSASLLFEIAQILRAQSVGMPTNLIPNSTMTPTSPFTPSTNAFLVNGLWFTSLAIALSTALFAVLAKQWLYYYLSSIPGTANEKVRARQLRFNGFESWKVAAIVDLLPILLHLAVGMFLTGVIIFLFPLDERVAWAIVSIAGITYGLYFISVILPIRYPECPYATSLTIYIGILFFVLQQSLRRFSAIINRGFLVVWRRINYKSRHTIQHCVHYIQGLIRRKYTFISKLAGVVRRRILTLRPTIFIGNFPKFTKWREENIKHAVENMTSLDFEALNWLYATSPNKSVHRIIARCAAVHPVIGKRFKPNTCEDFCRTLGIGETNIEDLRYGLCLDFVTHCSRYHWELLQRPRIPDEAQKQLEEPEYRSYLRIASALSDYGEDIQTLHNAVNDNLKLPLVVWCHFLEILSLDDTVAACILIHGDNGLFNWKFNPTRELISNAGLVGFDNEELGWWKFDYLFRSFKLGDLDYSSASGSKFYETCYLLLSTIYRNLTSDESDDLLISDKEQRQKSLENLFDSFGQIFLLSSRRTLENIPNCFEPEYYLMYFKEICCADSFWCDSMTHQARRNAISSLFLMNIPTNFHPYDYLSFMNDHDLTLVYQWNSRVLDPSLSCYIPPLLTMLFVPQNHHHLSIFLSNDPDAVLHLSNCLHNLVNYYHINTEAYVYSILTDLLGSVSPKIPPFNILYDHTVLVQLWKLVVFCRWDTERYFLLLKSKLDRKTSGELFLAMIELARSDNLANLVPNRYWWFDEDKGDIREALQASACEFGQLVGVSYTIFEATIDEHAPENAASGINHDTEERAQMPNPDKRKTFYFTVSWMKKVFNFIWPHQKTSVK